MASPDTRRASWQEEIDAEYSGGARLCQRYCRVSFPGRVYGSFGDTYIYSAIELLWIIYSPAAASAHTLGSTLPLHRFTLVISSHS